MTSRPGLPAPRSTSASSRHCRGRTFRVAWEKLVIPVVSQFEPDWVLVSAGFDGHTEDPLADLDLLDADYGGWLRAWLGPHPPHRTVFALEGGTTSMGSVIRLVPRCAVAGEDQFGPLDVAGGFRRRRCRRHRGREALEPLRSLFSSPVTAPITTPWVNWERNMEVNIEDLRRAVSLGATDLHLKVGSPPVARVGGDLERLEGFEALKPADTQAYAEALFTPGGARDFKDTGTADFAFGRQDIGRFRVTAFRQRGSVSLVLRRVFPGTMSFADLGLPTHRREATVNRRGSSSSPGPRLGQDFDDGVDPGLDQHQPGGVDPHGGGSDRGASSGQAKRRGAA